MDELNKRVMKIIDFSGLSKSEFATKIDISLPVLTHISSGRNKPSLDIIIRILQVYKQININWLLFGDGEMLVQPTKKIEIAGEIELLKQQAEEIKLIVYQLNEVVKYNKIFINEIQYLNQLTELVINQQQKGNALVTKMEQVIEKLISKV
ncbi:MAG: helix-turn-helix domain-containing protein [Bacteroidia bacterium]